MRRQTRMGLHPQQARPRTAASRWSIVIPRLDQNMSHDRTAATTTPVPDVPAAGIHQAGPEVRRLYLYRHDRLCRDATVSHLARDVSRSNLRAVLVDSAVDRSEHATRHYQHAPSTIKDVQCQADLPPGRPQAPRCTQHLLTPPPSLIANLGSPHPHCLGLDGVFSPGSGLSDTHHGNPGMDGSPIDRRCRSLGPALIQSLGQAFQLWRR